MSSTSTSKGLLESQLPLFLEPIDKVEFQQKALAFFRSLGSIDQLKNLEVFYCWKGGGIRQPNNGQVALKEIVTDVRIRGFLGWYIRPPGYRDFGCQIELETNEPALSMIITINHEVWQTIISGIPEDHRKFIFRLAVEPEVERLRKVADDWKQGLMDLDTMIYNWRKWLKPDQEPDERDSFDPSLPYDDTPGPFVVSPFTVGRQPRPDQEIVKGL